jgi:hypothetical protein
MIFVYLFFIFFVGLTGIYHTQYIVYDILNNNFILSHYLVLFILFLEIIFFVLLLKCTNLTKWIKKSIINKIITLIVIFFVTMFTHFSGIIVLIWQNVPLWR